MPTPEAPAPERVQVQDAWGDYIPKDRAKFQYGYYWKQGDHQLAIELRCYRVGVKEWQGGLGKGGHFREAVNILWGDHNEQKKFIWNPWADRMLEKSLEWKYLSVAGCANAGKSDFYAVYAIVNWLSDPINTMVLITSTSLKESKGRIWGSLEEYWNAAQSVVGDQLPGKLVSSMGMIKLDTEDVKASERSGIHLIAGEKKKEKEAIGKLIGMKRGRVFLIADELPELSPAILEAAFSNLDSNPEFQLIGIGNPNSIYDPHGIFSIPKNGWKSVNPTMDEWETDKGFCIRFDAYQSPNVLAGRTIYPWLPTQAKIDAKKKELGEDSLAFWRMWRGYWCPTGGTETVVAEQDIVAFEADQKVTRWKPGHPVYDVAFLDAGYTNGGDRSIVYFAKFGINWDTDKITLAFVDYEHLKENVNDKKRSRNFQIAQQFKEVCEKRGIPPQHAALDETGAAAFADIVQEVWSPLVSRVNFGGAASETILRWETNDKGEKVPVRACDKFKNRVTEIWCVVRDYIRAGQIRGIGMDFAIELVARKMVETKKGAGLKAQVQPKEIVRAKMGFSPDIADAGLGLLDFCRTKFKFKAYTATKKKPQQAKKSFQKFAQRMQSAAGDSLDYAA